MLDTREKMQVSSYMSRNKIGINAALFIAVTFLAFYTVLRGQNLVEIWTYIRGMSPLSLIISACLGICFVAGEGVMIWYLLRSYGSDIHLLRCIHYSFIGFFYSGITPSATGGQPMQLYYMKKDGNSIADSSVVLMVVAAMYKFVLVIAGLLVFSLWGNGLKVQFQGYYWFFLLGLFLNTILVAMIIGVMLFPNWMMHVARWVLQKLKEYHIMKEVESKCRKVEQFVTGYQKAVCFLKNHIFKIVMVFAVTVLQRSCLFFLTYFIYRGLGLDGSSIWVITALQISVYVAVDMLPIPGAQGITEVIFKRVFMSVLGTTYMLPVMLVSRGINFYLLFFISMLLSLTELVRSYKKGGVWE
ncbi:MAG: lysylphosphatidylglycerol synthase transmembrane domain-containing protein [Hespellia sp.]|nr:lysylphosphatidylglycerol synthase transmembrane domain-containing protein [Hespellia sp.]